MSPQGLEDSLHRAKKRLGDAKVSRRPRRDRGQPRLPPAVLAKLEDLLQGQDRPPVRTILEHLGRHCAALGLRSPARATIYQAMSQIPAKSHDLADLPRAAREALYNLPDEGKVPGHQLAFYCLNYGGLGAISYAAGLPWLALYQAGRMPGWRPRSKGLLEAIRRVRGI
jgi:hypothetical protein